MHSLLQYVNEHWQFLYFQGTCNGDSVKRKSMETEDSDLSEAKRLKEDSAIPHPIQAN